MRATRLLTAALALLLCAGLTASEAALTAHIKLMRGRGPDEQPEPATTFALGDTVVCAIYAKGYRNAGKGMNLKGSWSVTCPDGSELKMDNTEVAARNSQEVSQDGVLLRPVRGWGLNDRAPGGLYRVNVTLQDVAGGGKATASVPVYMFLTPGARDQITAPTEKAPMALDTTLMAPGLWDMSKDAFLGSTWRHGFGWMTDAKNEVKSTAKGLTFMEEKLAEASASFDGTELSEIRLSIYNRGDGGLVTEKEFETMTERVEKKLRAAVKRPPQDLSRSAKTSAGMKQKLLVWRNQGNVIRLDYAWSKVKKPGERFKSFQPEYVNVVMLPSDEARTRAAMAGTQEASVSRFTLPRNVVRLDNGDVYIDGIPMVDQGEKGYCAAATAERVLSYYGTDTDQHELAQRMLMETGGGASFESLVRGLKSIAYALKVQLKMIMKPGSRAFMRMIEDYNKEAKLQGHEEVDVRDASSRGVNIWTLLYPEVFLDSRLKEKLKIQKFMKAVQEKIDKGIPICQACVIGVLPEEAELEQEPGGHLRLIIGYNLKTKEVLYTDSWGAGHEMKRLAQGEAFAITTGLFTLEPK